MKNQKILLYVLIAVVLIMSAAATTITQNDITITSNKDTYFCEPIQSQYGCLIQTQITIENGKNNPINAILEFDANQEVTIREFRNKGQEIATQKSQGKNIHSKQPYHIPKHTTETYNIDFWTHENGKFNVSVFFLGQRVTLDPFFNTTYNNSNPTLHLDSGRVTSYNDSEFIIIQNLTNELNDLNDLTNFETSRTQFTTNAIISFLYQGVTSYFGEVQARGDGANATENMDGTSNYFEANLISPITNGDELEIHFQDAHTGSPSSTGTIYITNTAQTVTYANFTSTTEAETYFLTMANINTTTSSFRIHADAGDDTGDKELIDLVRIGETVEGQALRVSYPITIDTNNDYFLRIKKVSGGTEDIQVMYYIDGTDAVDTIIANETFSPGYNNIPLSIPDNRTASFRVFSAVIEEIAEVFLIEMVEDTIPPTIINTTINPTVLACNEIMRFSANVTDDNGIGSVFFTYNTSEGTFKGQGLENVSNIFTLDVQYSSNTNGLNETYQLSGVNVTDLGGLSTFVNPQLNYLYNCNITTPEPPQVFKAGVCPATTTNVILLGLFVFFALALILIGVWQNLGFISLFGGLMLLPISWYVAACSSTLALMLAGFGVVMIIYSVVSNLGVGSSRFD